MNNNNNNNNANNFLQVGNGNAHMPALAVFTSII